MKITFQSLIAFIISFVLFCYPALAQLRNYPPPLSYSNAQLVGRDFSNQQLRVAEFAMANMHKANFANSNLKGAIFSGGFMTKTNLHGADLTNAMLDQANLTGADLSDAVLVETLLLRTIFNDVDITGADFTDAILDGAQVKQLCQTASGVNSQTGVATRDSLGCRS